MYKTLLKYTRLQTAGLTIGILILASIMSGNTDLFPLIILGLFIHMTGFSMNNYFDHEYDKISRHHNPISNREISIKVGYYITIILAFSTVLMMTLIHIYLSEDIYVSHRLMSIGFIFGILYNTCSKRWKISPVFLYVYVVFLFLSVCAMYGNLNMLTFLVSIYGGLMVLFQTGFEGEYKDWGNGESNLEGIGIFGLRIFGSIVKYGSIGVLILIMIIVNDSLYNNVFSIMLILSIVLLSESLMGREFERGRFIFTCSILEIMSWWVIVFVCVNGFWAFLLMFGPFMLYVGVNKVIYKDYFKPQV